MDETTEEVVEVDETPEAEPFESETSRYLRVRAEAKAEAAVTMKAEAKRAEAAKRKALAKAPVIEGQAEFYAEAKRIEQKINSTADPEEK